MYIYIYISSFKQAENTEASYILSCVRGSVTNNNRFWVGCWDLLTPLVQSLLITMNYNNLQSIYCRGLAPFSFSCLNSLTTSQLTPRSHVFYLREGPNINHRLQQFLYYCMLLCCGNVFSDPLPGNRRPSIAES
jgi:hypothetical protein